MTFPQCLPFAYADLESDDGAPRTKTAIMTPESKESTSGGEDPLIRFVMDVTATADQLAARFVPAKGGSFTDASTIGR